jgi:peptidoglycan-N-acetylglucosamine deacetylase
MGSLTARIARRAERPAWLVKDALAGAQRRVSEGTVALTFDDGPHPISTSLILDVLGELGVKATFFCVGRNARKHPDLIHRAVAEGHSIGSHSLTHPHPAQTDRRDLAQEYKEGRRAVEEVMGSDVLVFRPPHGHLDLGSAIMVRRQGLLPWLWSVDPQDWRPGATTAEIVSVAARAVSGDVILLHDWVEQPWAPDALDRSATVRALPEIVREVSARGLRFVGLPM